MYTALQARNIAKEKENHKYYTLYRRRVNKIMRDLTHNIQQGHTKMRFYAKTGARMELAVLRQIAKELRQVGYSAQLYEEKLPQDNWKNWYLEIKWDAERKETNG